MSAVIRRHPLAAFFVCAYLGSWLAWSPWWLSLSGAGVLTYRLPVSAVTGINQLGLFAGPFAAALIVTRVTAGREGVAGLLRRMTQWRVRPFGYVLALVLVPVAAGVGYFLTGRSPASDIEAGTVGLLVSTYFIYLLGGPVQEEPGWRGFALPRLPGEGLVFTAPRGGPLRVDGFRMVWKPAVEECGLNDLLVHDLRDTAASLAIASGASIKAVQRMLGHASAAMTLDVYGGLYDDDLEELADRLEDRRAAQKRKYAGKPGQIDAENPSAA